MTEAVGSFASLIGRTLVDPASVAQFIMQRSYDRGTLWMGVILVSILSVMLLMAVGLVVPIVLPLGFTPTLYGMVMGCVLIVLSMSLYLTGQMLGGTSTFPHAFALIIWLEMTALCLRAAQALASIISPTIAGLLSVVSAMLLLRVFVVFVNETHGFNNLPRAAATIFIAIFGIAFGFGFFMAIIGIAALIGPIPVAPAFLRFDLWVMLGASVVLIPFVFWKWNITRTWGIALTLAYFGYIGIVLF